MEIIDTSIEGMRLMKVPFHEDVRGWFLKIYNMSSLLESKLHFNIKEIYFSESKKGVIRGMHFQLPPMDHTKIVFVLKGEIDDVLLDLRKQSSTYLQYEHFHLKEGSGKALYLPKGIAHGFSAITENVLVGYLVSSEYDPKRDTGIKYDSFGYDWNISHPIVSTRDLSFPPLEDFSSPF